MHTPRHSTNTPAPKYPYQEKTWATTNSYRTLLIDSFLSPYHQQIPKAKGLLLDNCLVPPFSAVNRILAMQCAFRLLFLPIMSCHTGCAHSTLCRKHHNILHVISDTWFQKNKEQELHKGSQNNFSTAKTEEGSAPGGDGCEPLYANCSTWCSIKNLIITGLSKTKFS